MARKTIYMGPRLKRLRRELRLTQADMAADLDISPSYVALLERNQRPVTADLLLKLASIYQVDLADLAHGDLEQTTDKLQAILRQPFFSEIDLPGIDIADIATSYPGFAEAMLRLHQAHDQGQLALAIRSERAEGSAGAREPGEEVGAFLAAHRNSFAELDHSAEALATKLGSAEAMAAYITRKHQIRVEFVEPGAIRQALRFYDYHRARLLVNAWLDEAGRRFQLALHIAMLEQHKTIAALLDPTPFESASGRVMAEQALRNYWAAAVLMPYAPFLAAARRQRYDVAALAAMFQVSFEQAAHRLTTLQQPGASGVPFFLVRVDQAGNVSKRLDGSGLPLARMAGGCPLWAAHTSLARPQEVSAQLVELPDGQRFVTVAHSAFSGIAGFAAARSLRAVALTCSAEHLDQLVYADHLADSEPTAIGLTCRVCHRLNCMARSALPIGREALPDTYLRSSTPFAFDGE
jgi:XRE family transcriptional regulator, fatty acid utilization regulator